MTQNGYKDGVQLLPIVDSEGIEYFVDIDRRQFRAVNDVENIVGFHTVQGRDMVKAMMDTEWRRFRVDNLASVQTI